MLPGLGLSLLDCAKPARTTSNDGHESLHLSLPRSRVTDLLGPSPAGDGASFRQLPDTPLAQILKTNLAALAQYGMAMDPASAARAMETVSNLAMGYLAQFRPKRRQDEQTCSLFVRLDEAWSHTTPFLASTPAPAGSCAVSRVR